MNLLGIEIGGTKLQLVIGNELGIIQERRKIEVAASRGGAGIRQQIEACLPELTAGRKIDAVGVGFGGPVDWQQGRICCSHQLEGWSEFDLGDWLRQHTQTPIHIDNDANVAALGEAHCGAGRGFSRVFYVTLGSGVGGGMVMDGAIYHGALPGEAELGHIRLDRNGTIVESRCSGWAVDAQIRELNSAKPIGRLAQLVGSRRGGEARYLAQAIQEQDADALQLLHRVAEDLAFGLSHVTHLFHPHVIVIGGGLSGVGETLRAAVAAELQRFIMKAFLPGPEIRLAALGEDTVPVGALLLARQNPPS